MIAREAPWLETISREDCLDRMRRAKVGRIGFVANGVPTMLPVNFEMFDGDIVFCTTKGAALTWLGSRTRVAFEIDDIRPGDREGWSVLIHGEAHEVTEPAELEKLRGGPLPSWLHGASEHWVRVSIGEISGRVLHAARDHAGDP